MLDNSHYNFVILNATLSKKGVYAAKDIKWKISTKSVAKFKKSGKYFSKLEGKKVKLYGLKYGTAVVTAKLPNGKEATCNVRVITSAKDSSVGAKIGAIPGAYLVKQKWTNNEVTSYINNAAAIIKKYPNKYDEGKKITVNYRYSPNNPHMARVYFSDRSYTYPFGRDLHTITKPKGQLDINGYVFFYSTKNQYAYLLRKDESGKFKVIGNSIAAAYNTNTWWTGYLGGVHTSTENSSSYFYAIYKMGSNVSESMYTNSVHIGITGFNHRTRGCTTIKRELHDKLVDAAYNGVLTRYIKY